MRLTTVAAIGVLPFDGRSQASATRGRRVAIHHEKTVLRHAGGGRDTREAACTTRRQRTPRSEGATLQPRDNRGQSAPVMAGLFWHSTQLLGAYWLRMRRHTQLTTPPLNHQTPGMKSVITYAPAYETHHTVIELLDHPMIFTDRACPGIHNSSCFGSLDGVILSALSERTY